MTVLNVIRPLDFTGYDGKVGEMWVPSSVQTALTRYVEQGIMPGGFLAAVLSNDLVGTFAQADSSNVSRIEDIVSFVYNRMPSSSWGSLQQVRDYADSVRQLRQQMYAEING